MPEIDIKNEIQRFREKLLDLTNRNPLLNYRKSRRRTIEFVDSLPDDIYDRLVTKGKAFKFDHLPEEPVAKPGGDLPDLRDDDSGSRKRFLVSEQNAGRARDVKRRSQDRLLANLSESRLESVLTSVARDAKTAIEETGINYLHLALGMLHWRDREGSERESSAPLVLVPIHLERNFDGRRGRYVYSVYWTEEEVKFNLSLAKRLQRDFGLRLPEFDIDATPEKYFSDVSDAVRNKPFWEVQREALVGFFSFHKLLMYQDIDPENWQDSGQLGEESIASKIIAGGALDADGPLDRLYAVDYEIDGNKLAEKILLPSEADSSQHSALCDIASGKSLVIEGPPGTGKSQTITNAIAMAMNSGKRVLFVAEKLAALEVVQKKLEAMKLGEFCLELHSDIATSRRVFESLRQRLDCSYTNPKRLSQLHEEIEAKQSTIAGYLKATESICGPYEEPLYELFWRVIEFRSRSIEPIRSMSCNTDVDLVRFNGNSQLLDSFVLTLNEFPEPQKSPWWGFRATSINPNDIEPVKSVLTELQTHSLTLVNAVSELKQFGGDDATWHNAISKIDVDILKELAQLNFSRIQDLDYLLDANARAVAKKFAHAIDRRQALRKQISSMMLCDFEDGLSSCDELQSALQEPNASLFRSMSIGEIEEYRVWLTSTQKALAKLAANANDLEAMGYGPVRNALEYESAVYLLQLFRHPAVEHASIVQEDLFLNSAFVEFRRGVAETQELEQAKSGLDDAFHLASAPNIDEITGIAKQIRPHVSSKFRFLSSQYRAGVRRLKAFWRPGIGSRPAQWVRNLESLLEFQQLRGVFRTDAKLGRLFEGEFKGIETNWDEIKVLLNWVNTAKKRGLDFEKVSELLKIRDSQSNRVSTSAVKSSLKSLESQLQDQGQLGLLGISNSDAKVFRVKEFTDRIASVVGWIDRLLGSLSFLQRSKIRQLEELDELLSQTVEFAQLTKFVAEREKLTSIIGDWYDAEETNTQQLLEAVRWSERFGGQPLPKGVAREIASHKPSEGCNKIAAIAKVYQDALNEWGRSRWKLEQFGSSSNGWLDYETLLTTDFACKEKIEELQKRCEELPAWASLSRQFVRCKRAGVFDFVREVISGGIDSKDLASCYQVTVLNQIAERFIDDSESLNAFSRQELENARKQYQSLDREITKLNQKRIAYEASRVSLPPGNSRGRVAEYTEMGLILHEAQKQQRHCRIRDLLVRAGNSVQALKPCFMMSPLSVAQYIAPNSIEFDLVVMDEASQIKPEDALGTILRAKQIVVVGDPKQLPPTSFFDRSSDETSDEEATQFDNSESILEAAMKSFQPVRRLRWHYRSQHESLIQFSNHRFYDDDLVVFPSPTADAGRLGIRYHEIEDASFSGGHNMVEAEAVADAVVKHVLERSSETLGVGTFNKKQSQLIEELIDKRCETDSRVQVAIDEFRDQHEDLFIKNLENLQGDERDVIFISYTYGPDPQSGRVMNRFGPINGSAGWRRLNVLITRARRRVEVFSSMRPSQIAGGPGKSKGVNALKDYLEFASTGMLPERGEFTGREPDSPFEIAVANVIEAMGLVAVPQVGVAGYFIDLGVRERDGNGDFLLGIECDGATYHSSKSARDRDRLREEVIVSRGWQLHRIWSTDWFLNQKHEEERLRKVLEGSVTSIL